MDGHRQWFGRRRPGGLGIGLAQVIALSVLAPGTSAADRQFLVKLGTSPKQEHEFCAVNEDCAPFFLTDDAVCSGGRCVLPCQDDDDCNAALPQNLLVPGPFFCRPHPLLLGDLGCRFELENPELIRRRYFVDEDSFAEYWREISYGDVTINGRTTEWIDLPWRFVPVGDDFENLSPNDAVFESGRGETFFNDRPMIPVDLKRDDLTYAMGGGDVVWMPGERFVDMDDDGEWDGLDEARNQMDFFNNTTGALDPDGVPDNLGPWTDLNDNGEADNADNCTDIVTDPDDVNFSRGAGVIYLPDSDNDGNPDCCPNGPGQPGCEPWAAEATRFDGRDYSPEACPPTSWTGPGGSDVVDCNGNLIPDACDVAPASDECQATGFSCSGDICGKSRDELPFEAGDTECDPGEPNGIPDECEFENFDEGGSPGNIGCIEEPPDPNSEDPCVGRPVCIPIEPDRDAQAQTAERCEFHDVNGNGVMDQVEPFENFISGIPSGADYEPYVRKHYPGDDDKVLAQRDVRPLTGAHDPLGKLPSAGACICANGSACGPGRRCPAGVHAQYDPPDAWAEVGSAKMEVSGVVAAPNEPPWYRQAWLDRFGTTPPPWTSLPGGGTPGAAPIALLGQRKAFFADRGGLNGDGTGWVGNQAIDTCEGKQSPDAVFFDTEAASGNFQDVCEPHRILAEELQIVPVAAVLDPQNNIPRIFYDGSREFHDLPSSKYHSSGDSALGEVTSPFSDSIAGDGGVAAGPYATGVHGNFGFPAGNVLHLELLTFFSAVRGAGDATLDGHVDQGEYIFNRSHSYERLGSQRMIEDLIETLDEIIDFDDFVDPVGRGAVECVQEGPLRASVPFPLSAGGLASGPVRASGILSGIALIPPGLDPPFSEHPPVFSPIHNADGLGDPNYPDTDLPRRARNENQQPNFTPQVNWNLFLHDLTLENDADRRATFTARLYLEAWEGFPTLDDPGPGVINCPIGLWDIMGGERVGFGLPLNIMVHSIPPLKARDCPAWLTPVDLTTVLTPGVAKLLTLPPYEFVRDESVFFLENEIRPGERYYLWSAGSGFDVSLPGEGMLVLHADEGSNPEGLPPDQRSGERPTYGITQADGDEDLRACTQDGNAGDAGDPWPGTSGATEFGFDTIPAATWYTENAWTGLEISDVVPDGNGSVQIEISWLPTTIPSLEFLTPPGGTSVRLSPTNVRYRIDVRATDVFGGTTIRTFFTEDQKRCGGQGSLCARNADCAPGTVCKHDLTIGPGNLVGEMRKTTPGTNQLGVNWNIVGVPDGRYVLFADLVAGAGADGTEQSFTAPRAGRNNVGNGALVVNGVNIGGGRKARLEAWTIENIDAARGEWVVNSSLTQPAPAEDAPDQDPWPHAFTGAPFNSPGGEVRFTIQPGSIPFAEGDRFSFVTSGITAVSAAVRIDQGEIREDPRARIVALPLSGPPPLTVQFDGRSSTDPNGQPLQFRWDFGDGSPVATGGQTAHTYSQAGLFTAVLRATNPQTGRFGEASVDINVVNNSPRAVIRAEPVSGPAPLAVRFDGSESSDQETPANQLVYQWSFGDGQGANPAGTPGTLIQTDHFYTQRTDGTQCTSNNPCSFTATLTVTDGGGKSDSDTIRILVGNTNPVPSIVADPLVGPAPLTVRFNTAGTFDSDGDTLTIDWTWGDGEQTLSAPIAGPGGNGIFTHTYDDAGTFRPTAVIKDGRGGQAIWPGVDIRVTQPSGADDELRAVFRIDPDPPVVNQVVTVDAAPSVGDIVSFRWSWGDGTADTVESDPVATHTYTQQGTFRITLTVTDEDGDTASTSRVVVVSGGAPGDGEEPEDNQRPTAVIAVVPPTAEALVGEAFTFDGRGSRDPDDDALTFLWTFGDGSAPVEGSAAVAGQVAHAYSAPGQYMVRLTVRDPFNAASEATRAVRVLAAGENRRPVPVIATGPRSATVGGTLSFDGRGSFDPDGDDITFTWEFRLNGTLTGSQTEAVVSQRFDQAGRYTVTLTVEDDRGAESTSEPETVIITPRPTGDGDGDGEEPPGPRPPPEIPDSAQQRPPRLCAFGLMPGLFGGLLALSAVRVRRRLRGRPD